ncbi:hypothetical protein EJB05_09159, partial [Eragrostis curvula]
MPFTGTKQRPLMLAKADENLCLCRANLRQSNGPKEITVFIYSYMKNEWNQKWKYPIPSEHQMTKFLGFAEENSLLLIGTGDYQIHLFCIRTGTWTPLQNCRVGKNICAFAVEMRNPFRHPFAPSYLQIDDSKFEQIRLKIHGVLLLPSSSTTAIRSGVAEERVLRHAPTGGKAEERVLRQGAMALPGGAETASIGGNEWVLSHGGVVLLRSDLSVLGGPHFINDRIIAFYFAHLASTFTAADDEDELLLLPPSMSFLLANLPDPASVAEVAKPLRLRSRRLVLIPMNDNADVSLADGGVSTVPELARREDRKSSTEEVAGRPSRVKRPNARMLGPEWVK